ncbi:MAG: hypothetical protein AAGL49_15645, partial [Pseudomonadota bacterium]
SIIREEAAVQNRSIAGQIAHWVRIGREIERSSSFDYAKVRAALSAELSPDDLTPEEQIVWFDELDDQLADPAADRRVAAAYGGLAEQPGAVGLDDAGDLVVVDDRSA